MLLCRLHIQFIGTGWAGHALDTALVTCLFVELSESLQSGMQSSGDALDQTRALSLVDPGVFRNLTKGS